MATAKQPGRRRHRLRNGLSGALLLAALGVALFWRGIQAQATLATSYGARIACVCHYVAGRDLTACRQDFEPGMALVMLSDDALARSITARIPLVASQTAAFRGDTGCVLQAWHP